MSGDDVKRNQTREVQQDLPQGAGTAGAEEPVRWVGLQHVMSGYCGRAVERSAEAPAVAGGLRLRQAPAAATRVAPRQRGTDGPEEKGGEGPESRAA